MRAYLEDRKIDKKYIRFNRFFGVIAISLCLVMIFLVALAIGDEAYAAALIFFVIFAPIIFIVIIVDEKVRKKYNKLFKQRNAYYVFDLNKEYSYDDLVLLLNNIKKRKDKWYIEHENEMIFRLRYGFVYDYKYRINVIKYNNFINDEYQNKLIKLNKEYTDKFGSDEENYRPVGKYSNANWLASLHRINFIYSNELNKELEYVISKNAYYYFMSGITSQTIVIIGNKMYVPSIRRIPAEGVLKYTRTINNILKWFNIEVSK